jgi:hypothetical protein
MTLFLLLYIPTSSSLAFESVQYCLFWKRPAFSELAKVVLSQRSILLSLSLDLPISPPTLTFLVLHIEVFGKNSVCYWQVANITPLPPLLLSPPLPFTLIFTNLRIKHHHMITGI